VLDSSEEFCIHEFDGVSHLLQYSLLDTSTCSASGITSSFLCIGIVVEPTWHWELASVVRKNQGDELLDYLRCRIVYLRNNLSVARIPRYCHLFLVALHLIPRVEFYLLGCRYSPVVGT
jgi:hypothetical protein